MSSSVVAIDPHVQLGMFGLAPEQRSGEFGPMEASVTSFEAFRSTYDQSRRFMSPDPNEKPDTLGEPELRRRYEALRDDRIRRNTVEARRSIVMSTISLLVAAALFAFHWRWLRGTLGAAPPGTTRIDI